MADALTVARRFMEDFIGKNDTAAADEVVAADVVAITGLSPQGPIQGREPYKGAIAGMHATFPDLNLTIEDAFVSDDGERVVMRINGVGTHTGAMMGLEPTNRQISMRETHVIRVRDGQVVENYVSATNLEFEMLFADVLRPMILPDMYGK